eukprot:6196553-Pleurochrysis_carterae.AAC.1
MKQLCLAARVAEVPEDVHQDHRYKQESKYQLAFVSTSKSACDGKMRRVYAGEHTLLSGLEGNVLLLLVIQGRQVHRQAPSMVGIVREQNAVKVNSKRLAVLLLHQLHQRESTSAGSRGVGSDVGTCGSDHLRLILRLALAE